MRNIIYILVLTFGLSIAPKLEAQETIETNISPEHWALLKTLACTGDSNNPQLQASLKEIEFLLNQALSNYGFEITDEQLESLGTMATETKLRLESEESVKEFCSN